VRIVNVEEAALVSPESLGGKGARLVELTRSGIPVPAFLCVTTLVHQDLLKRAGQRAEAALAALDLAPDDRTDKKAFTTASAELGQLIREIGLEEADRTALLAKFDQTFAVGTRVAVRSSSVGEDSTRDSFAGQMDSFLEVTRDGVMDHVLRVFASAFTERALFYRKLRGHDSRKVRMAVVIQQMVESHRSGVLFTANPTSGDLDEAVVVAGFGLGQGIVASLVESDTFFLQLSTAELRDSLIVEKVARIVWDRARGQGVTKEEVPIADRAGPCLGPAELKRLVALGRQIQELQGVPQDVEWAIDESSAMFVLQTRPITTLDRERETIFDNSNVIESYPDLSLPLTFSFVQEGYEKTFRASSRAFGVPEDVLAENQAVHANLVALVDGRIYYNILNWYRLFQLVPGFEGVLPAWEGALGLPRRFVRRAARPPLTRKIKIVWRSLGLFLGLGRTVRAFLDGLAAVLAEHRALDLPGLDAHALVDLNERLGRKLYEPYAVAVINDFFTQQLHDLLGKLISRFEVGASTLRNELLCGDTGMDSVEPVRSVLGLAAGVRADARLQTLFASDMSEQDVLGALHKDAAFEGFRADVARHISLYGDRTLHELKLETPTLEERPAFLVSMIRNYLRGGQNVDKIEERERETRERAERSIFDKLAGQPLRRTLFRFVLERYRRGVRFRENLRLARSRAYGMLKRNYRALGRLFKHDGLIDHPDDVFYLGTSEVAGTVRGHALTRDLRALIALRRKEYEGFALSSPSPRIVRHGIVYAKAFDQAVAEEAADGEGLSGIACSSGRMEAAAKVILDPQGDLDIRGEILVAPMTDPGWVFLMVASSGIVAERGSLLSHTAIIGRELGIPTVVGVKDATRRIRNGDRIEIDGEAGTVRLDPARRIP
jgi:phosphohistidine swiveling domain-containing protein